jgi:Uma2 family endonuclease
MGNAAYTYYDDHKRRYEMVDGQIIAMAPQKANHKIAAQNIFNIFKNYLKGKTCMAFADGMDVVLTEKDRFVPDMMVVCDRSKINKNGFIDGAPNLVVEVLSPSTAKRDRSYKKNLYERFGVNELWIVDWAALSVEVYLLTEGKYELDNIYAYADEDLGIMAETERNYIKENVKTEFSTHLFPDLCITLDDIFMDLI